MMKLRLFSYYAAGGDPNASRPRPSGYGAGRKG
jgi:hypothetical protein